MSKQIEFQSNGRTYLLCRMPEGKTEEHWIDGSGLSFLHSNEDREIEDYKTHQLPEGEWKLIGKASELTEEQAAEIVAKPDTECYYGIPLFTN